MNLFFMMPTFVLLLPGVIAFFIFLGTHGILWQASFVKRKGVILLANIAFVSYCVIFLIETPFEFKELTLPEHIWLSLPLYLFLVMLYFHFYVGIDRSVSIRILGELAQSKKGMNTNEIRSRYSPTSMLKPRCDGLVASGWLNEQHGVYRCTKKGALLAKAARIVQQWYHLEKTG